MTEEPDRDDFSLTVEALTKHSGRMRTTAGLVGLLGGILVAAAATYGWYATGKGAQLLKESGYDTRMLVFELTRIAAGAALLGAFAWGVLNLARAALDQSTRYEKRLIAGYFLVYVVKKFEKQIKQGDIDLKDVMSVFKAWSDSVDSAFTHVKFGSKNNQAFSAFVGKDGVSIGAGGASPVAQPRNST